MNRLWLNNATLVLSALTQIKKCIQYQIVFLMDLGAVDLRSRLDKHRESNRKITAGRTNFSFQTLKHKLAGQFQPR